MNEGRPGGRSADAQIATFDDTWSWGDSAEETFEDVTSVPGKPADILLSLRLIPGTNDMLAYLTMMTARLAVDEQFEQHRRMIARPSRPSGCMTMKVKGGEVEFIDEEINDTGKVIFADPVLQTLRKERCLIPLTPSMKPDMPSLPTMWKCSINRSFYTVSAQHVAAAALSPLPAG